MTAESWLKRMACAASEADGANSEKNQIFPSSPIW